MEKINKDNLAHLGYDYQIRLVLQILIDKKFANNIVDIIDPNYFEDLHVKIIVAKIKQVKIEEDITLDMASLKIRLFDTINDEVQKRYIVAQLNAISNASLTDSFYVQDKAIKFCKHQELVKAINKCANVLRKGNIDNYPEMEEIMRKALDHGNHQDDGIGVFDNLDAVLSPDFRDPIPTGISGLDQIMNGGLSKSELAVILAPYGVGKTTMMVKTAATACGLGKKVVHIYFEDKQEVIQRKYLSSFSGIELNSLSEHIDEIKDFAETLSDINQNIKIKKFGFGTTVPMIRTYIRKLINSGFKPDIILLDYIDCLTPSEKHLDINVGEGMIMREFEGMLSEFDIAGWTAVQGNRSSINSEVVTGSQMGGSIKKGQIGHFIVSIAKTENQKYENIATISVIKSRFGKDGIILPNISFNNSNMQIDMTQNQVYFSEVEYKRYQEKMANDKIRAYFENKDKLNNNVVELTKEIFVPDNNPVEFTKEIFVPDNNPVEFTKEIFVSDKIIPKVVEYIASPKLTPIIRADTIPQWSIVDEGKPPPKITITEETEPPNIDENFMWCYEINPHLSRYYEPESIDWREPESHWNQYYEYY